MATNFSRSATNSPVVGHKKLLPPSPISATNIPRILRSKFARHQLDNEKVKEEARRMLMDGQQKLVIIPSSASNNCRFAPTIRVCSTNSSDSSEGKVTPPRHKRHHHYRHGRQNDNASMVSKIGTRHHTSKTNDNKSTGASLRSLKTHTNEKAVDETATSRLATSPSVGSFTYSQHDMKVASLRPLSDMISVRSLVSISMGSTDGKKLVIRRVPTSPSDLLNFAHASPHGITNEDDFSTYSHFSSTFSDLDDDAYKPRRRYWSNKLQFILACVGYSVGIGNLWRFPYLCYKSGGGVFLIPYFLILLMCGMPLLYMELAVGQFTRRGPIGSLSKLCPIFKGVGLSSVVVSFFLSTYYNVIIAYALFYFFTAFRGQPPWDQCNNRWNSNRCWPNSANTTRPTLPKSPAEEFYMQKVLQMSGSFEDFGQMRWELVACSFIIGVLVYFTLWKSVGSSGRVLYFTATVPFVLVLVFLIHAVSLEGADIGLKYLLSPNWQLLLDSKVWVYAAAQNLNSIGLAVGLVISFASYNKSNNQILHDTITVTCINAVTSLLVAIFAFATIGNIAFTQQEPVENVITDGPGLIFVVYPEALSKIPFASFWSVLFFFTLLCLGLNTQFAIVEVVVTSIQDGFPNWIKKKLVCHEILVLVVCLTSFLIGLPNVFQGGIYFFQLIDYYVASISIIYIAFFEIIAISWIYGTDRLSLKIEKMTKHKPNFYFTYCWRIVTPLLLMCLWIFSLIDYEPPIIENYQYPAWAELLGWIFAMVTLISVPVFAVYVTLTSEGDGIVKKISNSLKPRFDDYCSTHSDDSQERTKNVKELETLIDCKMNGNNNNLNSKTSSPPSINVVEPQNSTPKT